MADEPSLNNSQSTQISDLLTEFLISAEVTNAYTLDEFKEVFPPTDRNHKDIKLLYKAFQIKRKKLRAIVRQNVAVYCAASNNALQFSDMMTDIAAKKDETKYLKETLLSVHKNLKVVESQLVRCAKRFKEKDLMRNFKGCIIWSEISKHK